MQQHKKNDNPRQRLFLVISFLCGFTHSAYADFSLCHLKPFLTLGGGIAVSGNLGKNTTFPDPDLGGIDVYRTKNEIQSTGAVDGFLGVELEFLPIGLQLGLGYNQTSGFVVNNTGVQGQGTINATAFTYQYKIVARQYLAEGKVFFNLCGFCHPYASLGAGISQNGVYSYQTDLPFAPEPEFTSQTSSSFSYIAGIGIDFDVCSYLRLGLGYRFADFGKVQLDVPLLSTQAVGTISRSSFYVHEVLVQITFV